MKDAEIIEPGTSLMLGKGYGPIVEIDETRPCISEGCTNTNRVHAKGPEDSQLIRWAQLALDTPSFCDACADRAEQEQREQEAAEARERRRQDRLQRSNIPTRWRDVRFEQIKRDDRSEAIDAAFAWAEQPTPRGLLLYGEPGRGKTLIAAVAAAQICARMPVRWLSVSRLQTHLRMGFDSKEYRDAVRSLTAPADGPVPALVLDDIDKFKPTEHALQPIYEAVNSWVEANGKMIVTANRDVGALADWMGDTFGEPVMSRIVGHCQAFEVRSKDWRTG